MPQLRHPQRDLYFDHGDPRPGESYTLAELEALPPLTPPRTRPVGRDDDLGFDRFQVRFIVDHMC